MAAVWSIARRARERPEKGRQLGNHCVVWAMQTGKRVTGDQEKGEHNWNVVLRQC